MVGARPRRVAGAGGGPLRPDRYQPFRGQASDQPLCLRHDQDLAGVSTPGARRYGGDRLTGYNWETNASNAGTDYINESDNYLVDGLPAEPAVRARDRAHRRSTTSPWRPASPYTILTLQMAGYVAADENGPVTSAEAAPSSRWNLVQDNTPGGVFPATPNLTDGTCTWTSS
jgi:hypothetical protein